MDKPSMKAERGKKSVTEEALEAVRRMVDATDLHAIESRRAPPPADEGEPEAMVSPEDCAECAAGTCTDPEHNEDALEGFMAGGEG